MVVYLLRRYRPRPGRLLSSCLMFYLLLRVSVFVVLPRPLRLSRIQSVRVRLLLLALRNWNWSWNRSWDWKVVRDDTIRRLQLRNPTVRTESFNRPNLKYEIRPKKAGILDEVKTIHLPRTLLLRRRGGVFPTRCSLPVPLARRVTTRLLLCSSYNAR